MFVEHKEVGEVIEQPAKVLKLSEAIRIGLPHVKETMSFHGCAIACASYAVRGYAHDSHLTDYWECEDVARHFGIPQEIADEVSRLHWRHITKQPNGKSRERIADWLEARGY